MTRNQACIFLNGDPPKASVIRKVKEQSNMLICADGAANYLRKLRIIPNVILGDLDSIQPSVLAYYRPKTRIIKMEDQQTTDFEKALIYCRNKGIKKIFVLGFSSAQADHTLGNYSVMKRYNKAMIITMIDDIFYISLADKKTNFSYKPGETVSLLALPKARGITTKGLEYPLREESLGFGIRDGVRNRATSARVSIKFSSGNLLVFRKHFIR